MARLFTVCALLAGGLALTVQLMLIVGNHGPVLPGPCFFGAGGFSLRPDRRTDAAAAAHDAAYPQCAAPEIRGFVDPAFQPVADALASNFRNGFDIGAGVTVYKDDMPVVDVVAGFTDKGHSQLFERDSLAVVFSCSKTIESLVVAMLVDRGHMDYEAPLCKYWPEFCEGEDSDGRRAAVTVGDLMRHRGGLAAPSRKLTFKDLADLDTSAAIMAKQPMSWHPSSKRQSYHAVTRGLYVRELVRRADPEGRTFRKFVSEEISGPLGIELYFGASEEIRNSRMIELHEWPLGYKLSNLVAQVFLPTSLRKMMYGTDRLASLKDWDVSFVRAALLAPSSLTSRSLHVLEGAPKSIAALAAHPGLHTTAHPSANAVTTAHALAKIGAVLANGGSMLGVTLLSPEGLAKAMGTDGSGFDECLFRNITYTASGWGSDRFGEGIVGWAGAGGSMAVWLPKYRTSLAYVPNLMATRLSKARGLKLLEGLAKSLASLERAQPPTRE